MCCFRPIISFGCGCPGGYFGWGMPMMGFGFPPYWGGGCCGNARNALAFGAGVGLGMGVAGITGAIINRLC